MHTQILDLYFPGIGNFQKEDRFFFALKKATKATVLEASAHQDKAPRQRKVVVQIRKFVNNFSFHANKNNHFIINNLNRIFISGIGVWGYYIAVQRFTHIRHVFRPRFWSRPLQNLHAFLDGVLPVVSLQSR
jgi:hypothetical protein